MVSFLWDKRHAYIRAQIATLRGPDVPPTPWDNYLRPSLKEQDWSRKAHRMVFGRPDNSKRKPSRFTPVPHKEITL